VNYSRPLRRTAEKEQCMSMDQAPENNLPPTGLRLAGDVARERDALRRQVAACERENSDLKAELHVLRSTSATIDTDAANARHDYWQDQYGDWGNAVVPVARGQMDALLRDYYTAVRSLRVPALQAAYEQAESDRVRVTEQWQQAEAHNNDVNADLAAVRTWATDAHKAAINRLAQGSPDPRYWQGQLDAAKAAWEIVKPVV
jgi:hypothetical protein